MTKRMNSVVLHLIFSDVFVVTGFGLIEPVMAIYLNDNLVGGSILTAGIASTIFLVSKSLVQLPFSRHVDTHGDQDDLRWLVRATFLFCLVPIAYVFATHIYHIFLAQLIYGVAAGIAYSAWLGLWSTHLDRRHESFEWSTYSTLVSIGTGLSAIIGAALAEYVGFRVTFISVGVLSLLGCFSLIHLKRHYPHRGSH